MTVQVSKSLPRSRRRRASRAEYAVYFAAVFVVALPIALTRCLASLVWKDPTKPRRDFVSCAWREAQIVTPVIFSA